MTLLHTMYNYRRLIHYGDYEVNCGKDSFECNLSINFMTGKSSYASGTRIGKLTYFICEADDVY